MSALLYQSSVLRVLRSNAILVKAIVPLFILPVLIAGSCSQDDGPGNPNIILILADDLGWADVGYNGQEFYETPNIDRLASEGMVLNRFYPGAANCAPSRACLLTGMFTPRHGVYVPQGLSRNGEKSFMRFKTPTRGADSSYFTFPVSINNVAPEFESLAELLGRAGYVTARFGKWHIGDDNQGFHVNSANGVVGEITNLNGDEKRFYNDTLVAQKMTGSGIEFISLNKDNPFFLYLSHWEVHGPMAATRERIEYFEGKKAGEGIENLDPVFAAEVEQLDLSVGRIMAHVEKLGLEENTIIIFSSDNGGSLSYTVNDPLRAGKGTFYEGGIRTPFCIKWKRVIDAGQESSIPVSGVDLMPTFAEILSLPVPGNQPVDGISILPLLKGGSLETDRSIYFHFPLYLGGGEAGRVLPAYNGPENYWRAVPLSVIIKGDWKLIYYYEYEKYELFNIAEDISESEDLAGEQKEIAERLYAELSDWTGESGAPIPQVLNR